MSLPSAPSLFSAVLLLLASLLSRPASAQPPAADTLALEVVRPAQLDTVLTIQPMPDRPAAPLPGRVWTVAGAHAALYGGTLVLLNEAWYKGFPKTSFQVFDDSREWLQVDKVGHAWTAYQLSRLSMASWRWAGLSRKQQIWLGGLSGFTFQTVIEVLDAHSAEWGWSWADVAANTFGSGMLIGQELAWGEQRISFKFGFHRVQYPQGLLTNRANDLFGASLPERMLKDYNGQTYWLSANLRSFFKDSNLPPWLNIAVGYGASNMLGGFSNKWTDPATNLPVDLTGSMPRQRQWYLAPDIDFTRIKTRSKFLRSVFFCLNAFKLPTPTLALTNGKLRVYGLYF